jgi:hypothetical protein
VKPVFPPSLVVLRCHALQLVENAWCEPLVDDVVRQVSKVLRLLDSISRKVETAETGKFAVEIVRERPYPRLKLFSDERSRI